MSAPSRRTIANRRNAKRSTGPKTPGGKARSAANALRHGLATSVRADPYLDSQVEALAETIVGADASSLRLDQARRLADVQFHLMRIQRARIAILEDPKWRSARLSPDESSRAQREILQKGIGIADLPALERAKLGIVSAGEMLSLAEGFQFLAQELARLDRYERRALSRRRSLIREYVTIVG